MNCNKCGKVMDFVLVNFFDREGDDSYTPCEFTECNGGAVELDVDNNWTGYELTEEEQMETILCPHCRKFPFEKEIQVYDIVRVVMFGSET